MVFTGTVRRRVRTARSRRLIVVLASIAAVVAASVTVGAVVLLDRTDAYTRASSLAPGSDLAALTAGGSPHTRWTSVGQTTGAWVESHWSTARRIDRVRVESAGLRTFRSGRLTFSDGSTLLVTPNRRGAIDVSFPARSVRSARLTMTGGVSDSDVVSLSAFVLSSDGHTVSGTMPPVTATASSTAAGSSTSGLVDGDAARGVLGAEWSAVPGDATAKATVRWSGSRPLSATRIWGPTAAAFDPAYSAAAALNGYMRFSDGSTVRVSGIAGGSGEPTTIAFTPRMSTSVTLVLKRTIPQATIGLRGIQLFTTGEVPTITAAAGTPQTSTASEACMDSTPSSGAPASDKISLVCPSTGAAIDGRATVRIAAPAGTPLSAQVQGTTPTSALRSVASGSSGDDGTWSMEVDTSSLPHGPVNLVVSAGTGLLRPLHVQLFNPGGRKSASPDARNGGRALVWDEEFDRNISISSTGSDATYAALKPEYWGGSQFGDAVFDDPASGTGTFSVVDGALRIRAQPIGDRPDPGGYGRKYLGGLLSSLRVGATGFSAQYGYYEARMMAPAATGTWPAFWMMSDDSATQVTDRHTEVDAVELYGHSTKQTCHSVHNYVAKKDDSQVRCIDSAIATDWGVGWHTYGVQIEPGRALFYVDRKLVLVEDGMTNSDEPFYFMANLALGGGWPVDLSPTGGEADLWIDYIRVYV